jgi:FtsZ-interacting cell division protein YlmF
MKLIKEEVPKVVPSAPKQNLLIQDGENNREKNNRVENNRVEYIVNKPRIFTKKSKIVVIKPLTYINSDTGKTRHFTPAAQE